MTVNVSIHLKPHACAKLRNADGTFWVAVHNDRESACSDVAFFLPVGTPPAHVEAVVRAINAAIAAIPPRGVETFCEY